MKRENGVTLIELLVTIAIAVILMTVAVPGFQQFMISNRLSGMTTEFMGTINLARSEAVKRGRPVSLCRSADGTSCAGAGDWSQGWIVFLDINGNGARNAPGDTLLRTYPALTDNYTVSGTVNSVVFARNGAANAASTFAFCQNSQENRAQAIIITLTRPRIATDADADGIPEKEDGTEIISCENP